MLEEVIKVHISEIKNDPFSRDPIMQAALNKMQDEHVIKDIGQKIQKEIDSETRKILIRTMAELFEQKRMEDEQCQER
jgi:RecG-like helicase